MLGYDYVRRLFEVILHSKAEYQIRHSGILDALEVKFGIPVIYTSLYRELAEENAASWIYKHFTYWYLESNGFGRVLIESDL